MTPKARVPKLLNPGPVTLTPRVRAALSREDLCHREPECARLTQEVIERLGKVYETGPGYVPVLLSGSGTCAVEAMIGTLVPRGGEARALVVANGVYGERAAAMLEAQLKPFELARASWTSPMDVGAVERRLAAGGISHLIAVHHETTTGRLNDLAALGRLARTHRVPLLLDAVSSFGGEEIRFGEWNLEACAATANKCLHGAPGIAFVLARAAALDKRPSGATSVYLDLHRYRREQASGSWPFTPAVHPLIAFREALLELSEKGGWRARNAHYRALTERVTRGFAALGIELLLESAAPYSSILTSYRLPRRLGYEALHDRLKEAGFVIYAGQGKFDGEIFRVAVMGDLDEADIERLLVEVELIVSERTVGP